MCLHSLQFGLLLSWLGAFHHTSAVLSSAYLLCYLSPWCTHILMENFVLSAELIFSSFHSCCVVLPLTSSVVCSKWILGNGIHRQYHVCCVNCFMAFGLDQFSHTLWSLSYCCSFVWCRVVCMCTGYLVTIFMYTLNNVFVWNIFYLFSKCKVIDVCINLLFGTAVEEQLWIAISCCCVCACRYLSQCYLQTVRGCCICFLVIFCGQTDIQSLWITSYFEKVFTDSIVSCTAVINKYVSLC